MHASFCLQQHINTHLDRLWSGAPLDTRVAKMLLNAREELRSDWLSLVGGTEQAAAQIAERVISHDSYDTVPDGAVCHLCQDSLGADEVVASGTFYAHRNCVIEHVAEILPTPHQEGSTLCPCGCKTDLFTAASLS